jgi:hypothetical protein
VLLDIEDHLRMPRASVLPNFKIMIRNAFDFRVKGMPLEVQFLAADSPLNLPALDVSNLAALADESLNIEKRQ